MEFFDPEDFLFEEGKTALPQYSLTSSVLPRNEQLQLLDARFEKVCFMEFTDFSLLMTFKGNQFNATFSR